MDGSIFWGVLLVSVVLAFLLLLYIGQGCMLVTLPLVAFGFAGGIFTFILLVSGWNWVTFLVTDGNCAQRSCLFRGPYPQECTLPPIMSSRHCVRQPSTRPDAARPGEGVE